MAWPYGASRSHLVGLLWTSDHPIADNTQHSRQTGIRDRSVVPTHNPSKRAVVQIEDYNLRYVYFGQWEAPPCIESRVSSVVVVSEPVLDDQGQDMFPSP
jgi:hypothetical protein